MCEHVLAHVQFVFVLLWYVHVQIDTVVDKKKSRSVGVKRLPVTSLSAHCFVLDYMKTYQDKCDQVCERGSYSLFNCMYFITRNLTFEYVITLIFCLHILLTWHYDLV